MDGSLIMTEKTSQPDQTQLDNWDVVLGGLMHDVARLRRVVFDKDMQPLGITRSHAWVLARLGQQDGISQVELADMLSVGKAALGQILDSLESSGLISRQSDANDRRLRRVMLTGEGKKAIRAMRRRLRPLSENILAGIDGAERDKMIEVLTIIKENLLSLSKG